jgi:hypothetical protein
MPSGGDLLCGAAVAAWRLTGALQSVKLRDVSRPRQKETNMDLGEEAAGAVDALVADVGGTLDDDARSVARLAWLDGYEAGMKATMAKATDAFGEWAATQIGPQS